MGRHFNHLVEFTRHHMSEGEWMLRDDSPIADAKTYLEHLISKSRLCELPTQKQIVEGLDMPDEEILDLHQQFVEDAQEQGSQILLPFKTTAVEDEVTVVIADQIGPKKYLITIAYHSPNDECSIEYREQIQQRFSLAKTPVLHDPDRMAVFIAEVDFNPPEKRGELRMYINPIYLGGLTKKGRTYERISKAEVRNKYNDEDVKHDVATGLESYVDQAMWLWSSDTFILRKAHNTIVKKDTGAIKTRKIKKGQSLLLKTQHRPHYICLSAEDMKRFILDESKEPIPAHFVNGHRRHYKHERYRNMRGQHQEIAQHFTGKGYFIARLGWTYMVMIKDIVNGKPKLVQYDRSSWYKANGNNRSRK